MLDDRQGFQCELTDELNRFNYQEKKSEKESFTMQQLRFHPNGDLMNKSWLIDHEKMERERY